MYFEVIAALHYLHYNNRDDVIHRYALYACVSSK